MDPHAIRLAVDLTNELFGSGVSRVAHKLLLQGPIRLDEIARVSGAPPPPPTRLPAPPPSPPGAIPRPAPPRVVKRTEMPPPRPAELPLEVCRRALLVLTQHNMADIQLHTEESPNGRRQWPVYRCRGDWILHSIRWPRYLLYALQAHDATAEAVIESLLECGRLSWEDLLVETLERLSQDSRKTQGDGVTPPRPPPTEEGVRAAFRALVQARLVERVPPWRIPSRPEKPHENAIPARKGKAASNVIAHPDETMAAQANSNYSKERFLLPDGFEEPPAEGKKVSGRGPARGTPPPPRGPPRRPAPAAPAEPPPAPPRPSAQEVFMKAGGATTAVLPKKRKAGEGGGNPLHRSAAEHISAREAESKVVPNRVQWRANLEEFNRVLRHQCCVNAAKQRRGDDEAAATAALLAAGRENEAEPKPLRGPSLSMRDILSAYAKLEAKGDAPGGHAETLESTLQGMADDLQEALVTYLGESGPAGTSYCANIARMVDFARMTELDGTISRRFNEVGLRVFRILLMRGAQEQKAVAEQAMVPVKEAREVLYQMMALGFVQMFTLPKTSDHAPSKSFFLFEIDLPKLYKRVGADLYHAAFNLRKRLDHEKELERELFHWIEQNGGNRCTQGQLDRVTRIRRVGITLEACLLRLDEQVALFNDF